MRLLSFFAELAENEERQCILRLTPDASGATAIEYGLIAALIAIASVVVISTVGTDLSSTFNTVATTL